MDDTFNPATLTRIDTSSSIVTAKNLSNAPSKATKSNTTYSRIDLEPIYTDLKDAIGHKWDVYFDAITRFCRGDLHAREFGDATDEILYAADNVLHLHNKFICAVAFNSARDSPEPGIAAWVTAATDKSAAAASTKPAVTSDAGEQRLKKEVMAIHARDRRRLKQMNNDADGKAKTDDDLLQRRNQYEEAYLASRYNVPEVTGVAAGPLTKTNFEPEIKKRYQQALFTESAEFPDATSVLARMVPICYEEAIPSGSTMACAELVATSAEFYLKDFLTTVFERVRSDGPRDENSVTGNGHDGIFGGGIFTTKYKKQVAREFDAVKEGKLQRNRDDNLLPIESAVSRARRPIGINDIKLAERVGPSLWTRTPLLGFELAHKPTEGDYDDWNADRDRDALQANGPAENTRTDDEMDVDRDDDDDFDWEAEGYGGRGALDSLLDDCLAMPA